MQVFSGCISSTVRRAIITCEHTYVNGNLGELGTAGWGGVEVQASAEDVQVCNQGFHH